MNPDLFEKLKKVTGWSYEICIGTNGLQAFIKNKKTKETKISKGKSVDELVLWILANVS